MKWLEIPKGTEKPSWAGLFGAVPVLYIFWDPYQKGASWEEWMWTLLAFTVFLTLAVLASLYWARKPVMQVICAAMAMLALAFGAYRPSGVIFYIFVAAFGPLAMGGRIASSAAIIVCAAAMILIQWMLLWPFIWPFTSMPYITAAEALLVGAAITVVARQQIALRETLKTAERERIARDLHDILGHTLSVIILKSELASRLMDQDIKLAKVQIEDVEKISRQALNEVREAIAGYSQGTLAGELERAMSTLKVAGIEVDQRCEAHEISAAQERVLALVLREAVTNVIRHAKAKRCSIALTRSNDEHVLEIRDDGCGFDIKEGMGMRGIRERIAALGGTASWSTTNGTHLTIRIPMAGRQEAA
jgi:two-component system, NarL family, sensor histidine kinase DesK